MPDSARTKIADQRDRIIFGEDYDAARYSFGIRHFSDLTLPQINRLIETGALDVSDAQNNSPTVGEMVGFLRSRKTDSWYAHGYCVSPARPDFRIALEGVGKKTPPSARDIADFSSLFHSADIFRADKTGAWCWYD